MVILIAIFLVDFYNERSIISYDELPDLGTENLIRTLFISLGLFTIYFGLLKFNNEKTTTFELFPNERFERWSIYTAYFTSSLFLVLFIFKPNYFIALSFEDYPIEWCSALLLFGASLIFLTLFIRNITKSKISKINKAVFLLLAVVFFVICMEEISWFQRVLDVETNDFFDDNLQKETNFHNFYTFISEYIYYLGSFVFLVLLPYFKVLYGRLIKKNSILDVFIPSSFIILIGSITCAYNFDMWNSSLIQMSFFSSVIIILINILFNKKNTALLFALIFILVLTQIVFLLNFQNISNIDPEMLIKIKEYKEFFIALSFFVYSLDVYFRIYERPLLLK